jgi:hypothetical protein
MEDKHLKLKHRLAFGAAMSAFFCFSLMVFGPLKLYISSNDLMWFSLRSLLIPMAIISAAGFLIGTAILSLPPGTIHKALCCLCFGAALGLYIQCGFFNISYGSGVLDGSQIAWKDYTTYGAIDSAMWAACLALPFAVYMVFKRSWRHILMLAAAFILILQIGGIALDVYQNQNSLTKLSHEVTDEGVYDLSEEDNTLVFIVSSLDRSYYETYKKAHPEIKETLAGFTEYENAMATGSGSMESFPSMLTGSTYKKDVRYTEYIDKTWNNSGVYDLLSRSGADVRIFCDDLYFGNGAVRKVNNVVDRAQDAASYRVIASMMYRYALYDCAPHYLKRFFWMSLDWYKDFKSNITYDAYRDDKLFDGYRENDGFTYSGDYASAVRIYHLQGAKAPYRLDAAGQKSSGSTTLKEQVEGEFACIVSMIDDLKINGKYENARIIITADNGEDDIGQHVTLLYKEKGEIAGYTVSDAPVTLYDLPATLAASVTDDYAAYGSGLTFKDAESVPYNRRRLFYRSTGINATSRIEEYVTTTSPISENGLQLMNSYLINGGRIDPYVLGTELTFASDETAAIYCKDGFGHTNGWRTIMRGASATMEIPFERIPDNIQDLHAYFNVLNIYEETQCIIKANNYVVFNGKLDSVVRSNGLNFLIPNYAFGDGTVTLEFVFPEIKDNSNIMALTSFKIYHQ